ncbi:MAG: phage tail fiber domain-containing protein, partial [Candidatus Thorarchaeota archaeon]
MAVTYEETTSNGTQTDFNIIFPFLDRSHVEVRFGGVAQPTTAYSFLSDSQVRLVTPAAIGVLVRVARNTPKTILTDFNGGILPEADLDDGYLHSLYMVQELQDLWEETV